MHRHHCVPIPIHMYLWCDRKCFTINVSQSHDHKLSENVWVWASGASRSGGGEDVTIAGRTNKQTKRKDRATQPLDHGRLR